MPANLFPVTLEEAFMISLKVKHFIFRADLSPAFHYIPGQFITIHFEHQGKMLKRSYSIACPPSQNNRIEFAAGFVAGGPGTELLFNLSPGDPITINGPFGRLILKDEIPKRYILVATSTGVTPYRAMLNELTHRLATNSQLQVVILQGVQRHEDLLYADEFMAFAKAHPAQVTFQARLSRAKEEELQACEYTGYVQHAFAALTINPATDRVYLCGNPAMIDESFEYLKAQGLTPQQIIREKYISN